MSDIFISYARTDWDRVQALAGAFEQQGYSVWWDPNIPPGKTFDGVIAKALDDAKCVVVLWSNDSVNSDWVKEEASVGKQRDILIPAKIDLVDPPLGFGLIHTADLNDWKPEIPHSGFDALLKAISEIVELPLAKATPNLTVSVAQTSEPSSKMLTGPITKSKIGAALGIGVAALTLIVLVLVTVFRSNAPEPTVPQPAKPHQATSDPNQAKPSPSEPEPSASKPGQVKPSPLKTITNSIGMNFVLISAGTFTMGSRLSPKEFAEKFGGDAEYVDVRSAHRVRITKPFYLQTTEVTQGQWKIVMDHSPTNPDNCRAYCPVIMVSWRDAQEFIKRLNQKEGTNVYRLPTEAEWEYACRAGTETLFAFGNCLSTDQANFDGRNAGSGCSNGENRQRRIPVASLQANAWGLFDMHGNVKEWCTDWYAGYPPSEITDPQGPPAGLDRVVRGGGFRDVAANCLSAYRYFYGPRYHGDTVGFRLAKSITP